MARRKLPSDSPPTNDPTPATLTDLEPAPYNPRALTERARKGLRRSLVEFGDISGLTYNFRTGNMIAGHARREALAGLDPGGIVWGPWQDTDLGRERWGDVKVKGGSVFKVRGVDWPVVKEKAANVAANNPAIGGTFTEELQSILDELKENQELFEGLLFDDLIDFQPEASGEEAGSGREEPEVYTRKIKAPIYEPGPEKPAVASLMDAAKTKELLAEIDTASVPEDVRVFLRAAAERHTIFNFRRIADFYAHSEAPIQRLFEKSALVIIDFNAAIENGFVKFTERMFDLVDLENAAKEDGNEGEDDA